MCWSASASLTSVIFGVCSCSYLWFTRSRFGANLLFASSITCVQMLEYLIWQDQACQSLDVEVPYYGALHLPGLNRMASVLLSTISRLIVTLQPTFRWLQTSLTLRKKAKSVALAFAICATGVALFYWHQLVWQPYGKTLTQVEQQQLEVDAFCTRPWNGIYHVSNGLNMSEFDFVLLDLRRKWWPAVHLQWTFLQRVTLQHICIWCALFVLAYVPVFKSKHETAPVCTAVCNLLFSAGSVLLFGQSLEYGSWWCFFANAAWLSKIYDAFRGSRRQGRQKPQQKQTKKRIGSQTKRGK
ncbi:MAG: hypothetical protein MHM6MM_006177 [Cercozoa sp. M6MM]